MMTLCGAQWILSSWLMKSNDCNGRQREILMMSLRASTCFQRLLLCCSNVVQVPLSLNPFQSNLEFGTTHRVALCVAHPIEYTSHRISCCSVAFIEIKFQQKLCFNNQVLMLQVIHRDNVSRLTK